MAGIVERLVPDELWELFQRVVPKAPSRPQGGGRRRHGDREALAAIVFVASSGCTWQQLPTASFGPSGTRLTSTIIRTDDKAEMLQRGSAAQAACDTFVARANAVLHGSAPPEVSRYGFTCVQNSLDSARTRHPALRSTSRSEVSRYGGFAAAPTTEEVGLGPPPVRG
ncbi:transposase [Streptomyces sp. GMY02]|nr:transposase [Streptomyces sp. GMY02]